MLGIYVAGTGASFFSFTFIRHFVVHRCHPVRKHGMSVGYRYMLDTVHSRHSVCIHGPAFLGSHCTIPCGWHFGSRCTSALAFCASSVRAHTPHIAALGASPGSSTKGSWHTSQLLSVGNHELQHKMLHCCYRLRATSVLSVQTCNPPRADSAQAVSRTSLRAHSAHYGCSKRQRSASPQCHSAHLQSRSTHAVICTPCGASQALFPHRRSPPTPCASIAVQVLGLARIYSSHLIAPSLPGGLTGSSA